MKKFKNTSSAHLCHPGRPAAELSKRSKSELSGDGEGSFESAEDQQRLRKLLMTLIERADFLVEEDLNALMEVLPDKDRLLLKLDSILTALGVSGEEDIEKIFHHLAASDQSASVREEEELDGGGEVLGLAEKRSQILKIVRGYVEEPQSSERSQGQRMAIVTPFSIMKQMTAAIQPDKEGHIWDKMKDSIQVKKLNV